MAEQRWNLGKQYSVPDLKKSAGPAPVAEAEPREPVRRKRPAPEDMPPLSPPPGILQDEPYEEILISPGRPVPNPRTWREVANHPVTLVSVALAACLFWVVFAIVKMQGPRPIAPAGGGNTVSAAQGVSVSGSSDAALQGLEMATVFDYFDQPSKISLGGSAVFEIPETEPLPMRDGRVLISMGQMLLVTSNAMQSGQKPSEMSPNYSAIYDAPLPTGDAAIEILAVDRMGQAAYHLGIMGDEIARKETQHSAVAILGNLLILEGNVVMTNNATARGQLQSMKSRMSNEQINDSIRTIIPAPLADKLIAVRARNAGNW